MDENETVKKDTEKLEHLAQEIAVARHHLEEETHDKDKEGPKFYEEGDEGNVPG